MYLTYTTPEADDMGDRPVLRNFVTHEGVPTFAEIQDAVGGGLAERIALFVDDRGEVDLWVNEEGMYKFGDDWSASVENAHYYGDTRANTFGPMIVVRTAPNGENFVPLTDDDAARVRFGGRFIMAAQGMIPILTVFNFNEGS